MYRNILKNDLRRKKTMNFIVLIFVILATTFITSSVNNIIAISTAIDDYIEKSEINDYTILVGGETEESELESFFDKQASVDDYVIDEIPFMTGTYFKVDNKQLTYENMIALTSLERIAYNVFDKDDNKIVNVGVDEMYLSTKMLSEIGVEIGDEIVLDNNGFKRSFIVAGVMKDIVFGGDMIGATQLLVSEDAVCDIIENNVSSTLNSCSINVNDEKAFINSFNAVGFMTYMQLGHDLISTIYIMDMVVAGLVLVVSLCLVIISIIILRFTIMFTINEEFHEIGNMKAIGIKNRKIRTLYCVKYLAIAVVGAIFGFFAEIPFSDLLLSSVSPNLIIEANGNTLISIFCTLLVVLIIFGFSFLMTGKIKKYTPLDAIRNGEYGERFSRKGIKLSRHRKLPTPIFMAFNDILCSFRKYIAMVIIFTLGLLMILIPVNVANTLKSDNLVSWFGLAESDLYLVLQDANETDLDESIAQAQLLEIKEMLSEINIPAKVFAETMYNLSISKSDVNSSIGASIGMNTTTDMYTYLEGTPPQNIDEIALSHTVAARLEAAIGDTVTVNINGENRDFIVTATFQTMMNMGDGMRFNENLKIDSSYIIGRLAWQIKYTDNPDDAEIAERRHIIEEKFTPQYEINSGGEYVNQMININFDDIILLIIIVVLCINILVTLLMVKTFITKEKGEIAMLKAIGYRNSSIVMWQSFRIGIVLFISMLLGAIPSKPLSEISTVAVFNMMGASTIEMDVKPLEIYLIYPLLVLTVTVIAAILASLGVRKIAASETSNIE